MAVLRRRTIIDAAVEIIAAEGVAGATTRRIAERANAPLGALHYCFRDKQELVELVADRGATTFLAAFDGVDPGRGLAATIRDCVAAYWRWVRQNIGPQLALLELGMRRIRRDGTALVQLALPN
jgi:AcrR family transcriptional regulator